MQTKSSETGGLRIAVTLIGLLCASAAGAQQQPLDTRNLPNTQVQAGSCAEVTWERELLAQYPRIAEGCQEVIIVEGQKWARFAADLVSTHRDGSVTLDFNDRQGRSMEELTLMPTAGQTVAIGGRNYRFSELVSGQELSLYVPEGVFAVALEPGAAPERLAQIVREPVQVAQATPAPSPTVQLAQAEPARTPARLPNTAGPLPLVALGGLAALLAGIGLTVTRRLRG
jgi:hypothetical protein